MKVVIAAAGEGTRMKGLTRSSMPKILVPVKGRPILQHIVYNLPQAVSEIVFVVGKHGDQIKAFMDKFFGHSIHCRYVEQTERKGLAHAISLTRQAVDNWPILIMLDDGIFERQTLVQMCEQARNPYKISKYDVIGVSMVDDPSRYGVAVMNTYNTITKLVEKPSTPISNFALTGVYFFKHPTALYRQIDELMEQPMKSQPTGEYQLTDAIQGLLDDHERTLKGHLIERWLDCGTPEGRADAEERLYYLQDNKQIGMNPPWVDGPIFDRSAFMTQDQPTDPSE